MSSFKHHQIMGPDETHLILAAPKNRATKS